MNLDPIIEQIKEVAKREESFGNTTASNSRLENGELLWAALALMGYGYSQSRGLKEGEDAADFWPFGKFEPSDDYRQNLIRACQMILFEIDRIDHIRFNEVDNNKGKHSKS